MRRKAAAAATARTTGPAGQLPAPHLSLSTALDTGHRPLPLRCSYRGATGDAELQTIGGEHYMTLTVWVPRLTQF